MPGNIFGHVIRTEKLKHLVTTGRIEGKRSRGKQLEKMLDGLAKWLHITDLISGHARSFNVTGCCVVVVVGAGVVGDAAENETTLFTDVIVILYFYRHVLDNFFLFPFHIL